MSGEQQGRLNRRDLLSGAVAVGTAGLLGLQAGIVAAEPPPETTKLRLTSSSSAICFAPQYFAEELLYREGFTDVQYVPAPSVAGRARGLVAGQADLGMVLSAPFIIPIDEGLPLVFLAGVHPGCYELFVTGRVRSIRDLNGKTVAMGPGLDSSHVYLSIIMADVGLDPRKDVNWVTMPPEEAERRLAEGKIDALLELLPRREFREKKIGHVVLKTVTDRPWSQYFCCMVLASRDFVQSHPVATKRALRAILTASDICSREPERVAKFLVTKGYTKQYDYALQTVRDIPYGMWRGYGAEDTLRFYALRLHEVGMIKSSPQKIIAQGTDWHFLNELKRELRGSVTLDRLTAAFFGGTFFRKPEPPAANYYCSKE